MDVSLTLFYNPEKVKGELIFLKYLFRAWWLKRVHLQSLSHKAIGPHTDGRAAG